MPGNFAVCVRVPLYVRTVKASMKGGRDEGQVETSRNGAVDTRTETRRGGCKKQRRRAGRKRRSRTIGPSGSTSSVIGYMIYVAMAGSVAISNAVAARGRFMGKDNDCGLH